MKGLYLYCIREKTESVPAISERGIDGKGEVFTLAYRELEAVVSKISLEEFTSEEIQNKAQEDMNWIKEKAVIHEKIIEEAMKADDKILSLIPIRFGIIFNDRERLEKTLSQDYSGIKEVLERIKDKQEWSVKVYLKDRKKIEQAIKDKSEAIKEKEKEIASLPEGMAFFMEEELKDVISEEMDKELNTIAEDLFERLSKQAAASVKSKILDKELTGRREPMILNLACLVPKEKIENFKTEAQCLNGQIQAKGFYLEYSGPWPVYNFTSY